VIRDGTVLEAPFLDLTSIVESGANERGLLSAAFAPDYATTGRFYVYLTAKSAAAVSGTAGEIQVREYRRSATSPDVADPASGRVIVSIPHTDETNHNGGQLQFGPDGKLWLGTGDGGGGNNQFGHAQDPGSMLGKLIRVDPAAPNPEIVSVGLRNPWRFSFDRANGQLVIGDVGQNEFEEIDVGLAANYGWACLEGLHTGPRVEPACQGAVARPVLEKSHSGDGFCSITGGYVVRDPALPELAGTYLYGDNCTGVISGATLPAGTTRTLGLTVANVSSFGEDGCGRVYAASLGGAVYRFASSGACAGPAPFVGRLPAGVAAPAPDHRAPAFTLLRAAARQHALRTGYVSIRVRCDELCAVRASGRVLLTRSAHAAAARVLRTRTAKATLAAASPKTLRLKLSKATRRSIRRSLALRGRRATVRVVVRATDPAGNGRSATRRVRIVR